jgi:hypothetical protein
MSHPEALRFQLAEEPLAEKLKLLQQGAFKGHTTAAFIWLLLHAEPDIVKVVLAAKHRSMAHSNIMMHLLQIGFSHEEIIVILCSLPHFTSKDVKPMLWSLSLPKDYYNELVAYAKTTLQAMGAQECSGAAQVVTSGRQGSSYSENEAN